MADSSDFDFRLVAVHRERHEQPVERTLLVRVPVEDLD
jgi:hypothetical protein